jgi:hypothetical protein
MKICDFQRAGIERRHRPNLKSSAANAQPEQMIRYASIQRPPRTCRTSVLSFVFSAARLTFPDPRSANTFATAAPAAYSATRSSRRCTRRHAPRASVRRAGDKPFSTRLMSGFVLAIHNLELVERAVNNSTFSYCGPENVLQNRNSNNEVATPRG